MNLKKFTIISFTALTIAINLDQLVVKPTTPKEQKTVICTERAGVRRCNNSNINSYVPPKPIETPTPEPTPEQTPVVAKPSTPAPSEGEVEGIIREVFGQDADEALKVAQCESGFNPSSVGDKNLNPHSYGVFQIRAFSGRPSIEELLDARKNIEFSHQMFHDQGWRPWTCAQKLGL